MNISVSFTQRNYGVQLMARTQGSTAVQLTSKVTKTLVLSAGVRGEKGARGEPGVTIVALPDEANIDGGFF